MNIFKKIWRALFIPTKQEVPDACKQVFEQLEKEKNYILYKTNNSDNYKGVLADEVVIGNNQETKLYLSKQEELNKLVEENNKPFTITTLSEKEHQELDEIFSDEYGPSDMQGSAFLSKEEIAELYIKNHMQKDIEDGKLITLYNDCGEIHIGKKEVLDEQLGNYKEISEKEAGDILTCNPFTEEHKDAISEAGIKSVIATLNAEDDEEDRLEEEMWKNGIDLYSVVEADKRKTDVVMEKSDDGKSVKSNIKAEIKLDETKKEKIAKKRKSKKTK